MESANVVSQTSAKVIPMPSKPKRTRTVRALSHADVAELRRMAKAVESMFERSKSEACDTALTEVAGTIDAVIGNVLDGTFPVDKG